MAKRQEYKLAVAKPNGEIIDPLLENLAKERFTSKPIAQAFCDGVNAFRSARPTRNKGEYIVVEV